ncbi:MAG: sn-glycerol-3-phosphate ABC transporter substrate-binding protein UgpB [Proteobacteria bacterium]|nr:sn-glycerol-3-phosphate ABC transporter substrate-binding protein UgpB [Pseudomonadota bacterium]
MILSKKFTAAAVALAVGGFAGPAAAQIEIQWWHAMGGALGETVNDIAAGFNRSQTDYVIKAVYKGNYTETMTAGIAAFRSGKPPHIMQVFEVGTATMMAAKGAIYPVYKLMADEGIPFDESRYLSAVIGYYTTTDGKLLSMPFNSSTPVVFWNKQAFEKAGLDRAPETWEEMGEFSKKIIASGGAECGFTIGWQSWSMLENFSAWHDVPFATKENGFAGLDTEFVFNSPLHVKHIQQLADWQADKVFTYGGRRGEGNPLFANGKCAMLINSSAYYSGLRKSTKFDFGTSQLPYWSGVKGAPQNSIIGGATLWVLQGHPKGDYAGVAAFLNYLSDVFVQTFWHQNTGYVPITNAAYELTKRSGYYEKNEGRDVAIIQMSAKAPTANSKGLRLGSFVQTRDIINDELEAIWAGKKTAQQGLDDAVARGNKLLRKFEKANM